MKPKDSLYKKFVLPDKLFGTHNSKYGILIWFSIFAVIVPYILISLFGVSSMLRYLPVIDLIANIFTNSGNENTHSLFNDVYDINPNAIIDLFTANIINVLALVGVAATILYETYVNKKDPKRGMTIAIAMFIMTYLIPTRLIGLVGQWSRKWMAQLMGTEVQGRYGWFGMLSSAVFTLTLVMIEFYIITFII